MDKPLSHIRVLELSRILAGPWAGQLLSDLGAEVIKVERPGSGDDTRQWGPPFLKDSQGNDTSESAYYLAANRGKRSVTIDITTDTGRQAIEDLVKKSDVFIENYKVGGLKKYGLDYDALSAINPALIYCSITGFGQTGPYKQRAGYDFMIQAMGGLMSVTGEKDDLPGGGPQKVGVALADILTGLYATVAIQAALTEREKSGLGQQIDLALFDVQAATLANQAMNHLVGGLVPKRMGNAHPNIVPYQVFATSDGHIILAVGNDQQFKNFCRMADCSELAQDPRYATNPKRVENRDQLCTRVAECVAGRTTEQWLTDLEQAGVPCGPINRVDQVFADPQIQARNMAVSLPHPLVDEVPQVGNPINFSRTPIAFENAAPLLGQHNKQVLSDLLGYSEEHIRSLQKV
jgi:glutaryl-CoA transferase